MTAASFRKKVLTYYAQHGRHTLPWRKTRDPYKILVSEIMLQQTQVERVIPYFKTWIKKYPTVRDLAEAPLAEVLTAWQGLGYNRRAKMLHEAAKTITKEWKGKMPRTVSELESLPGVGSYTARAVAAFAYNQDVAFVETNIRTAVIHNFYSDAVGIPDNDLLVLLEKALPKGNAREWYAALMDYGSWLKRSGVRINSRSKAYIKQTTFKGSPRELRGAFVRALSEGMKSKKQLLSLFTTERKLQAEEQLTKLQNEGLITKRGTLYALPT